MILYLPDKSYLTLIRYSKLIVSENILGQLRELENNIIVGSSSMENTNFMRKDKYVFFLTSSKYQYAVSIIGYIDLFDEERRLHIGISKSDLYLSLIFPLIFMLGLVGCSIYYPLVARIYLTLGGAVVLMMVFVIFLIQTAGASSGKNAAHKLLEMIINEDPSLEFVDRKVKKEVVNRLRQNLHW